MKYFYLFLLGLIDVIASLIIIFNLSENSLYLIVAVILLAKGLWSIVSSF